MTDLDVGGAVEQTFEKTAGVVDLAQADLKVDKGLPQHLGGVQRRLLRAQLVDCSRTQSACVVGVCET